MIKIINESQLWMTEKLKIALRNAFFSLGVRIAYFVEKKNEQTKNEFTIISNLNQFSSLSFSFSSLHVMCISFVACYHEHIVIAFTFCRHSKLLLNLSRAQHVLYVFNRKEGDWNFQFHRIESERRHEKKKKRKWECENAMNTPNEKWWIEKKKKEKKFKVKRRYRDGRWKWKEVT